MKIVRFYFVPYLFQFRKQTLFHVETISFKKIKLLSQYF